MLVRIGGVFVRSIKTYHILLNNETGVPKPGKFVEMKNSLTEIKKIVGENIEPIYLTDKIVALVDEDGKFKKLPDNSYLYRNGTIADIIVGNIVCVKIEDGNFVSLDEADEEIIEKIIPRINRSQRVHKEERLGDR